MKDDGIKGKKMENSRVLHFRGWDNKLNQFFFWGVGIDMYGEHGFSYFTSPPHSQLIHEQYTGFEDKNDVKIYEGDIISFNGNMTADNSCGIEPNGYIYDEESKHTVIFDSSMGMFTLDFDEDEDWKYKRDTHGLFVGSNFEVIGNIHEGIKE